jgi:ELP3 family radical SAM enzyme/protein acetyltransferase
MPPDKFSCKYNCAFCPDEPGMPRSYLSNEDAVRRAASVNFDAIHQVWTRFRTLEANGHPIDKIEFRILGGTFSCYAHDIADNFIRDLYFAANTYNSLDTRPKFNIEEEQRINTTGNVHVVGIGVETRPDEINLNEIVRFREYGVTRVELGVQHTDDDLLRALNRGHGIVKSKNAIRLLKEYGFKIEIHIMADLPGSNPEMDKECYRKVLRDDPDLIPDYMKDYPCLDVAYTQVKRWKDEGRWKPYAEEQDGKILKDVLIYRQMITPPWVRVNRIQRDFAAASETNNYLGFTSETISSNLGEIVKREAEKLGIFCQCIRCCEVRYEKFSPSDIEYRTNTFKASGATEYFISAIIPQKNRPILLGFIRLRLCETLATTEILEELKGHTAMIRELHVYGHVTPVGMMSAGAQHLGIGKNLLKMAEKMAVLNEYEKIGIIAGIGVRDYYRKQGYELKGTYMMKDISNQIPFSSISGIPTFINMVLIIYAIFGILLILLASRII